MGIAEWQVKVADAGPAMGYEVLAQEGFRSCRFVAITDCRQGPAYAASALADVWTCKGDSLARLPTASMICIGDAHRIPTGQLYVMLHAVRGEAKVAAASKLTLPIYVDVS